MRNRKLLFLVLLLVAALIPYLITSFYALPFADDFCFGWTASEKITFAQKFLKQYLHWNGRYTSDVLVNLHPLTTGSLLLYQLVSFFSIIATPVVFFVFIRQWVNDPLFSIITALFISLFYLCYQPNITEGVYWYIGLVNYHWGVLFFILQLALLAWLLRRAKNILLPTSLSLLLLVIAVGFNEIASALIPAFYLGMVVYFKTVDKQTETLRVVILHFIVAVIASAFVIGSPGNFTRENVFSDRFNLFHSIAFSSLQTIRFIGHWVASVPFIALSLVVMVNADKVNSEKPGKINWGIWFTLLLFTVFMAAFIPYMGTGILGQHRTLNYVFPFFIILWTGALLSVSTKYRLTEERTPETTGVRVFIMAVVGLAVMSVSGNERKILCDMASGIFPVYREEFLERDKRGLLEPANPIRPLGNVPGCFKIVDAKGDSGWWVDKCMKRFHTETDIVLH